MAAMLTEKLGPENFIYWLKAPAAGAHRKSPGKIAEELFSRLFVAQ